MNLLSQKVDSFQSFEKARSRFRQKVSSLVQVGSLVDILHSRHTGSDFDFDSGTDIAAFATCPVDDSSTRY
jgi:hypothetical protein